MPISNLINQTYHFHSDDLIISAKYVPWDSITFGYPCAQITMFKCHTTSNLNSIISDFFSWINDLGIKHITCRIPIEDTDEIIALQKIGFFFIETVIHPVHSNILSIADVTTHLSITPADHLDIDRIAEIAECAFNNERYHADSHVSSELANKRYGNWVRGVFQHPSTQVLYKINNNAGIVGFFIIEESAQCHAYWHLTAIHPSIQGLGLGELAWRSVMNMHKLSNISAVRTTITSKNTRVMNLYAKLGFRFENPEVTFHYWCQ
jgi:RimJ/RimL family protein N-acetyltransferase